MEKYLILWLFVLIIIIKIVILLVITLGIALLKIIMFQKVKNIIDKKENYYSHKIRLNISNIMTTLKLKDDPLQKKHIN